MNGEKLLPIRRDPVTGVDVVVPEPADAPFRRARNLDRRIRLLVQTIADNWAKLYGLVAEAKQGEIHQALGFRSWPEYVADVFKVQVRLDRDQRRELVGYWSGEGMSQRVIADVVGVDQKTVSNDLRVGEENSSPTATAYFDDKQEVACRDRTDDIEQKQITGRDGKTYPKQPERKPKRKPITDAFDIAVYDLGKVTKRLAGLADDDRFNCNRSEIASRRLSDLQRAGQLIEQITDKVEDEVVDQQVADAVARWAPSASDTLVIVASALTKCVEYIGGVEIANVDDQFAAQQVTSIRDALDRIHDLIEHWEVQ